MQYFDVSEPKSVKKTKIRTVFKNSQKFAIFFTLTIRKMQILELLYSAIIAKGKKLKIGQHLKQLYQALDSSHLWINMYSYSHITHLLKWRSFVTFES